jgi:hypothetical protein
MVGASAVNRTVQAAVNLRKTIMDTIVSRQSLQSSPAPRIFSGPDDGAGDPLLGASEEHVQRIINSSGGPVATVRKYSADLAESNERVATERNGKIRLVEENRQLRAQLQDKTQEIEELLKRLDVAKQLFERYVSKPQSLVLSKPTIQIIDSPSGPYALEDSSGTILATLSDDFLFPESSPMDTPDSVSVNDSHIEDIVQRGKCKYHLKDENIGVLTTLAIDTIRPRKQSKPPRLPQRLVSAIKSEAVEMKSPVDVLNLPPALREFGTPDEPLVDRLGFYITADRERRRQEAAQFSNEDRSESSSINST